MRFRLFAAAAIMLTTALPTQAFDVATMTDDERTAFRAEIRAYLLENPEVLMEAIAVLESRRNQQAVASEQQMLDENRTAIFDDGWSYVGGNPDGDVTVVEFLDYRCGFCKRAFPAVSELIESDGNIRLIIKEFPILGPASELGSRYAIATLRLQGEETYREVHDELMVMRGDLTAGVLSRMSDDMGLDHDAIQAEMQSDEVTAIIASNRELASKLDIQGTPSFIMGENFVRGFVELDQMRAIVQAIRDERG